MLLVEEACKNLSLSKHESYAVGIQSLQMLLSMASLLLLLHFWRPYFLFFAVICLSTLFIAIPLLPLIKFLFSDEAELLIFSSVLIF
jgi:hypothetical protein